MPEKKTMNTAKRFGRLSFLFLAWCCFCASALRAQSNAVLGSGGELYRVETGAFNDLFPGQTPPPGVDPASSALALAIERPGAAAQKLLVPTTDGGDVETLPSLIYEDTSSTLYLVWERRVNNIHPVLMLTGFSNGSFTDPIELVGDSFADKSHTQIALTRDQYATPDASGNPVTRSRTILHVLWAQDDSSGVNTFYTPVIFEEGAYIGGNPVYRLNDLGSGTHVALGYPLSPGILHSPALESGQDGRTVAIGFVTSDTQKLVTVELDALPAALSELADKARAQFIDLGRKSNQPSRQALADFAQTTILSAGANAFRPEVLKAIADQVSAAILASSPQQTLPSIADMVRAQIVTTGAKFAGRGLRSFGDDATVKLAEVAVQPPDGGAGNPVPTPSQIFQMRMTSSRPAPNVASGPGIGETRLFVSETGERVIASWLDVSGNQLLYRVSDDGTWSDPLALKLSGSLGLQDAYKVLDQRVRNH
jgi:hypothetical protein